jgi:hypothetical protein
LPRKLRVFRTAVGFRDAYVAAPSRAAALRAWGTQKDLFARGSAEEVTDPALASDALSNPGEVVYRTRGGLEEQVAALGKLPRRKARRTASAKTGKDIAAPAPPPRKPPRPRPSRADVESAEHALTVLEQEQQKAEQDLRKRELALTAERKASEARFARQFEHLQARRREARDAYDAALREWEP